MQILCCSLGLPPEVLATALSGDLPGMRALILVAGSAGCCQPFYRADLGRALWPGDEWSAEQIDPIIKWLEAEGMICPMPGRTRAGWSSTKWVVVDGAAASAA